MSLFSKIKRSKKAAKEHKAKEKQKDPKEAVKVPYKHVPTHAAIDALSGAPSSWNQDDRPKIKEQHKRRSEMAISRTGSTLSHMSFPNPNSNSIAGPSNSLAPPLPQNSGYSGYNPAWFDRSGDVYHSTDSPRQGEHRQSRYKPQRGHALHDSGIGPSPLASNVQSEEASPVVSSGNSTNSTVSSDNLEIARPARSHPHLLQRQKPTVYGDQDIFVRLHTSTTRKLGEAPLYVSPPPSSKPKSATTPVSQEEKAKNSRWSLLGKKNTAAVL
ncbi:hypothetical protein LZ554_005641 [Drepanopeziza brunnea f. sp. 'monogermtubi']|nr:hypothetical protein LZ554_005641 [Drepanopeziza brunnea f. sp. 'monogermtubi']